MLELHQLMQAERLQEKWCALFQSFVQCDLGLAVFLMPTTMPKRYSRATLCEH
jgi:hypothetical protein